MQHKVSTAVAIGGGAFAGFVAGALLLTVLDVYLAGHSIEPLGNRPLLDVDALGIHLSAADSVALGLGVIAAIAAGLATRWLGPR
jgi:hypothetical protein